MLNIQQFQDIHVLSGLRHNAFVSGDDQQYKVDAADACQHIFDKFLMAGDVDNADFKIFVSAFHPGKTTLYGNAPFFFFF